MLDAKHLSKFLYIADMAICCDVCCKDTWMADDLSDEDIYINQLWHDDICPLKGRKDVNEIFSAQKELVSPYTGKLVFERLKLGNKTAHSIWLHSEDKKYRLVAGHEFFSNIELAPLDGQQVSVLGSLYDSTLYICMLIAN